MPDEAKHNSADAAAHGPAVSGTVRPLHASRAALGKESGSTRQQEVTTPMDERNATIEVLLALAARLWVDEHGAPDPRPGYSTMRNEFLWAAEAAYFAAVGR